MAGIIEKIKGFLFSPSETFDASKEDTLGDAFKYYIILLLIPALLSALIAAGVFLLFPESFGIMFRSMPIIAIAGVVAAVEFIAVLILGTIGVIIGGLWLHIWVYIMGGRKGLTQTFKASMYGETPYLLLCRIPDILAVIWLYLGEIVIGETPSVTSLLAAIWALNIIIGIKSLIAIWALIVTIFGIRQLHEISTGRAVAAGILAIIPLIVLLVLFVILRPAMMPTMLMDME